MSKDDLDGLEQNLHKMDMAKRRLEKNQRMIESRRLYKQSSWFKRGKMNKGHRWVDLHTETARAEPYYYVHWILMYRLAPMSLGLVGMGAALLYLIFGGSGG